MSIPFKKSLEQVRRELFQKISKAQDDGHLPQWLSLNKGPVRGLIELWAWGLFQLYQFIDFAFSQLFPVDAKEEWLDKHCAQVGVARQAATKAYGRVSFFREDTAGNVPIGKGLVVRTLPDGAGVVHRFVTTESVVLQDGAESVLVGVESEDYGRQANVAEGMISEIVTVIPGVDGVTNHGDWLIREAVDREADPELLERYILAWKAKAGSTKHAYEFWARSVPGVVSARILDRHPYGPGTVGVILKGAAGIPTQALIDEVSAVVEKNRPINDIVTVKGPAPVVVDVGAELELVFGTPEVILAEAGKRIDAMFMDPSPIPDVAPVEIAQDLTMDLLRYVIMAVPGIKKINFTSPEGDLAVPEDGLAVLGTVNLDYKWADEN